MPTDQLQSHYNVRFLSAGEMRTQLPKNIAIIRVIATIALTGLITFTLSATAFCWPVVIAGVAFAGWIVYSHLLSKDPLMEAFYKISGGKDKFEKLPEIQLEQNSSEKICAVIKNLKWKDLKHPISKTRLLDGRNVIIVKGFNRIIEGSYKTQTESILAFFEKLGLYDYPISKADYIFLSIFHALSPFEGNTFGRSLGHSSLGFKMDNSCSTCDVYSSISKEMANELTAQMA